MKKIIALTLFIFSLSSLSFADDKVSIYQTSKTCNPLSDSLENAEISLALVKLNSIFYKSIKDKSPEDYIYIFKGMTGLHPSYSFFINNVIISSSSFVNIRNDEVTFEAKNKYHYDKENTSSNAIAGKLQLIGNKFGSFSLSKNVIGMNIHISYESLNKGIGFSGVVTTTLPVSEFDTGIYALNISIYKNNAYALILCSTNNNK